MFDYVVLLPDDEPEMTDGGIVLPGTVDAPPVSGTVLAVGPGKEEEDGSISPLSLIPGQNVVYIKGAGVPMEKMGPEGEDVLMIKQDQIISVIA